MPDTGTKQNKLRNIMHCDLDAFFAAVEQLDNPALHGKPVVVGGDRDSRGVVSTCSYEARAYGIRSAMPSARAYRLCPQAVFLPVNMKRYQQVSQQVFAILAEYTPLLEPLSIDEAFMDISGSLSLFGTPEKIGREIKDRVHTEIGLTISVGISYNMFLAKLATELGKPDGLRSITAEETLAILRPLPVTRLWGAGAKTVQRLAQLGIDTIGDIQDLSQEWLENKLGRSGRQFWELAHGIDDRKLDTSRERKSLGREITFPEDIQDMPCLQILIEQFAVELCWRLRRSNLFAGTVTVKLRYSNFKTITRSQTITPSNADLFISQTASELLQKAYSGTPPLRLLGLSLGKLTSTSIPEQGSLFGQDANPSDNKLDRIMDDIRRRYGRNSITRGNLLGR